MKSNKIYDKERSLVRKENGLSLVTSKAKRQIDALLLGVAFNGFLYRPSEQSKIFIHMYLNTIKYDQSE